MGLTSHLIGTALVAIVLLGPALSQAAPYCDPRADSACYARWCDARGGQVYNNARGYGCDTSGAGGGGGGGSFDDQVWMGVAEGLVGSFVQGMLAGIEQHQRTEAERLRQLEIRRRAFVREFEEQERLRRRSEDERRQEFRKIKERLLRQMGAPPVQRDARPELHVDEAQGTLGSRELRPRDLRGPEPAPLTPRAIRAPRPALSLWGRASCGATLMHLAEAAARTGNLTEAAYLSEQAAGLLTGGAGAPDVECPPEIPAAGSEITGQPIREPAAMSEAHRKRALALSKLFARTTQLMADRRTAAEAVDRADQALAEARRRREQAEGEARALELPPGSDAPEGARERALAEALAALRDARQLEAESARLLAEQRRALEHIEGRLEQDREAAQALTEKPDSVDDLLRELNLPVSDAPPARPEDHGG